MRLLPRPWWPLLGVVLLALNMRAALSVTPPLLNTLEQQIGLTVTQASMLGALPPLAFAVAGVGGLAVMRRLGLERSAWAAMGLSAAGQLGRIVFPAPLAFLGFSAVTMLGLGLANVVTPPLVKRYFPANVALVTGFYVVTMQVGTASGAQAAVPLMNAGGWRLSLGVWVIVALVAAIPWLVVGRRQALANADLALAGRAVRHLPFRALTRSRLAWGMALLFGMQSLTAYALMAWLPSIYREAGLSDAVGGTALALFAVFQAPMSLFAPIIVSRLRRPFLLILAFTMCYAAGYLGLALAPATMPYLWAALLGVGAGPFAVALALIGLRVESPEGAAALSTFAQGLGYVAAISGPLVSGSLRQHTGSWDASLVFVGVVLIPMLIGGAMVSRPRTIESELGITPDVRHNRTYR